jgi:fructose-bisphosphate aldolase class II
MPVVPMREILDRAFAERYGVAAINVVDDLTLEAVLAAATDLEAPLIVQTSLKTVKALGARAFYTMWRVRADEVPVPVTLHLDHCPDREWISTCLRTGWNSVLFDGSELDVEENTRQTIEVVAEADGYGAQVEGEIETVVVRTEGDRALIDLIGYSHDLRYLAFEEYGVSDGIGVAYSNIYIVDLSNGAFAGWRPDGRIAPPD